jgi:hypothetical protein
MTVYRYREDALGVLLANDIFVKMGDNFARSRDVCKQLFGSAPSPSLLIEDRLAEFNTIPADVDITWAFYQGTDVPVAFPTE